MKSILFALPLLALLLAGTATAASFNDARVRVIHASPDAPNVDVKVDGATAFNDVAFNEETSYARLPRGNYNVEVVPAGAMSPVVIDADLQLHPLRDYTVIAVETLANIEPLVLQDRTWWFNPNRAKVRFVHASPDAPSVDIAVKDGPVLFEDVEFKEATRYLRLPTGTYDLEVRVAGTNTVALELPDVALNGGTVYTAVATGLVGDGSLGAVLTEEEPRIKIRFPQAR